MLSAEWIALLRRFSPAQQSNLSITMTNGIEFAVQELMRFEECYIVFRGRVAGSTEAGRSFFVPYDQINFIAFRNPVKVEEVARLYGEGPPVETKPAEARTAEAAPPPEEPRPAEPVAPAADTPRNDGSDSSRPATPGKAMLLDRLRSRLRNGSGGPG